LKFSNASCGFKQTGQGKVIGIFYAAATTQKKVFIKKETNNAYLLAEVPLNCDGGFGPAKLPLYVSWFNKSKAR